ncbi:uncharacterized protein LOC129581395 isoform X1 [Paramacrobiotus metropolitanus]|uniref:uncharacterized protein LOC129581395 isoform X1 n=1 Tax=Paramacrobiotus metropolitanus TaxID=2943436 RepID=UPI002446447E|nr:uncharacterized protein LOC129581395 isoform X1 [Paramacrobiotus metropolitanus]XP_055328528.1 uncharacterized protein LOC129581395 isoform X1 [Paramacrobiotus metropolitanus]
MMAEMPPSGGSFNGGYPPPAAAMPASRSAGGIGFNRRYFTSIGGICTVVAMVCALIAMICVESTVSQPVGWRASQVAFHEFSVITSWIFLSIFIVFAGFSVHNMLGLTESTMNFIVIGHSAFWCFFTFVSSCVIATHANALKPFTSLAGVSVAGYEASAAFGFFESFALLGAAVITVLHVVNKFHAPSFD